MSPGFSHDSSEIHFAETGIYVGERDNLRTELKHLKECQVKYFMLSVSATGILFGLASYSDQTSPFRFLWISPLFIVLPCWWIFFDKATSITRIVGYYRVLEDLIIGNRNYNYLGWENSLGKFRIEENPIDFQSKIFSPVNNIKIIVEKLNEIIKLKSNHLYWIINWWTFFALSLVCIVRLILCKDIFSFALASLLSPLIIITASVTLEVLHSLINGNRSYVVNEKAWRSMLQKKE